MVGSWKSSTVRAPRAAAGPARAVGSMLLPSWICSSGSAALSRPVIRLIQPTRALDPGLASSTSSMASKWLRLGCGSPMPCTAPKLPAFHIGTSGARAGCRPQLPLPPTRRSSGTTRSGRFWVRKAWSGLGTTMDRPSEPPRIDSTTTTLPSGTAAYDTCRKASPNRVPAASVPVPAATPARSRRRLIEKSGQPQRPVAVAVGVVVSVICAVLSGSGGPASRAGRSGSARPCSRGGRRRRPWSTVRCRCAARCRPSSAASRGHPAP